MPTVCVSTTRADIITCNIHELKKSEKHECVFCLTVWHGPVISILTTDAKNVFYSRHVFFNFLNLFF